jgi:hypothetical protein
MAKITIRRDEQRRVVKHVNALVVAMQTYGGHMLIENPASSSFWHQDFMKDMERDMPTVMRWRDIVANFCRVGSEYFKPICFRTTTPPVATAHMEGLVCDHAFKHPRCVGRDGDGASRTKATSAYTHDLVMMLVMIAGVLAGTFMGAGFDAGVLTEAAHATYVLERCVTPVVTKLGRGDELWSFAEWIHNVDDMHKCYLANVKLEAYWEHTKDAPPKPGSTYKDFRIHKRVPTRVQDRVLTEVKKHKRILDNAA